MSVQPSVYIITWVVADGLLGVAGRVVEGEAGAEEPEEDGGAHARDRRHVQLAHEEVPLPILHLVCKRLNKIGLVSGNYSVEQN